MQDRHDGAISISDRTIDGLVSAIRARYPSKSFGYLLSDGDPRSATDFVLFDTNIRNEAGWRESFETYGEYFVRYPDAGFVATPEESWVRLKEIWDRGMREVGVFHSHRRHPANVSRIDYDMHTERFESLWHLVVSMRNPAVPVIRAFRISRNGVSELPFQITGNRRQQIPPGGSLLVTDAGHAPSTPKVSFSSPALRQASHSTREARLASAIDKLSRSYDESIVDTLGLRDFLARARERYEEHVAPTMTVFGSNEAEIGTDPAHTAHFCAESPRHVVHLSPFAISSVQVTNELFSLFDTARRDVPRADRHKPVTNVSWTEAALFALWMGCRLPTEAEWEFACGGGLATEWCCASESELDRYCWYSKNSGGVVHEVATREPNQFGLFDLHGNIWEWCQDTYDPGFYARSPQRDPVCTPPDDGHIAPLQRDRVVRGGSMMALAEMCRTRYRFHEAPRFQAADVGIRLASNVGGQRHGA